jgi:hypothetical protein
LIAAYQEIPRYLALPPVNLLLTPNRHPDKGASPAGSTNLAFQDFHTQYNIKAVPAFLIFSLGFTMVLVPNLRVMVDGDANHVYRQGERVKGRVILVLEEEQEIKALKLNFAGACITKTSRPRYVAGNDPDGYESRQNYEKQLYLFNTEEILASGSILASKKHTWNFDFAFPDSTEPQLSRWTSGSKFLKDPHQLPPSFYLNTDTPGGQAMISYHVQAKLIRAGAAGTKRVTEVLAYHPSPSNMLLEPKVRSRVLNAQTWKPVKDTRAAIDRVFTKISRPSTLDRPPQIVPILHYVEKIAPGQHIPLLLSLTNARDTFGIRNSDQPQYTLDSLVVTISTYTTSLCGQPLTQLEDVVAKHMTCISKQDINQRLSFSLPTKLTTNFCLVDDAECVPSFKTYTITRRYTMTVVIGIKFQGQNFTIKSTTQLEILPRIPREMIRGVEENEEEFDPLPLYKEREMSMDMEKAPDYESLYALMPTSSASTSTTHYDLTFREEGSDAHLSQLSTPEFERDRPIFA